MLAEKNENIKTAYEILQRVSKNKEARMARGLLEKYKNTELLGEENSAWEKAMVDKYENS